MATFTVKIDTDSAAFGDETGIEIAIILRGIADDVESSMPGASTRYFSSPVRARRRQNRRRRRSKQWAKRVGRFWTAAMPRADSTGQSKSAAWPRSTRAAAGQCPHWGCEILAKSKFPVCL
jgi:hypothetical protein